VLVIAWSSAVTMRSSERSCGPCSLSTTHRAGPKWAAVRNMSDPQNQRRPANGLSARPPHGVRSGLLHELRLLHQRGWAVADVGVLAGRPRPAYLTGRMAAIGTPLWSTSPCSGWSSAQPCGSPSDPAPAPIATAGTPTNRSSSGPTGWASWTSRERPHIAAS
jgi:hypothetical protein